MIEKQEEPAFLTAVYETFGWQTNASGGLELGQELVPPLRPGMFETETILRLEGEELGYRIIELPAYSIANLREQRTLTVNTADIPSGKIDLSQRSDPREIAVRVLGRGSAKAPDIALKEASEAGELDIRRHKLRAKIGKITVPDCAQLVLMGVVPENAFILPNDESSSLVGTRMAVTYRNQGLMIVRLGITISHNLAPVVVLEPHNPQVIAGKSG